MATRHNLTLQEKIHLIFDNNEGNGLSQRKLAAKYNISFGSVSNILKRKKEYLNDYEANRNQNVKRKFKNENGQQLDDQIYECFVQQRTKRIPISGPILQEKAREIAESVGDKFGSFKASNGWLDKFKTRHNISHYVICGEGSSVDILLFILVRSEGIIIQAFSNKLQSD
jgi:transposase